MDVATRYKLLEKIGAGSFATVYRAQDQELGREVAVKQIHSQFLAETSQFERYWKEATLLASFQHPHIVTIYDVVRSQGWLILELMQANLRDRLQGRPMDLKAVQTTLTQALRALSALHARGLVHGDIKPSNLMIDHRKRVKVGDFGLARRVSHDDGSVIRGTAKYMAPETLSQDFGEVGPQSDLYSLGFTAYELMCGSKFDSLFPGLDAFGRDRQAAWMMWHAALDRKLPDPAKALENVPPALAKVVGRLVEKDPRKRYETADEALADLGASPGDPLTRTVDSGPAKKGADDRPKNRTLVIALFCTSMAASLAMLFWNPEKAVPITPAASLATGIVRSVDPKTGTIELIDPATGQPEEFVVAEKTPIRLSAGGTQELVLLKRLQAGDWVRPVSDGGQLRIDVSRPATRRGQLAAVDSLASKVTVAVESQRLRDNIALTVPASTRVLLNGKPTTLKDLQPGDRVVVDHLLDPAGKLGELASRLEAFRTTTHSDEIAAFDAATSTIRFSSSPGENAVLKPATVIQFEDGTAAGPADLAPGATVAVTRDVEIRKLVISQESAGESGVLKSIDGTTITLQRAGEADVQVQVPGPSTRVMLNGTSVPLSELRLNQDRVTVLRTKSQGATITSLRADRIPRFDRFVLSIASSTNVDRSIPRIDAAADGAREIADVAVGRYAVPPEWAHVLTEPTHHEVLAELKKLENLRPSVNVIIVIKAQAFLVDGRAVLAFADYQPNNGTSTGLALADLLTQLDSTPPARKFVFLDVLHPRSGFEDAVAANSESLVKGLPSPSTVTLLINSPQPADSSSFEKTISDGLSGKADADRDLVITAAEWAQYLTPGAAGAGATVWPQ